VPLIVLYVLAAFMVLNVLSVISSESFGGQGAFFLGITTYLLLFGLFVTGYVNSAARARSMIQFLMVGAAVIAALSVAGLFIPFPGSNQFTWSMRAKGLFDDPNVFGAFLAAPLAVALAELVEPRLLRWRRGWVMVILLACGAGILFSYSRAAWLNATLIMTTMVLCYAVRRGTGRRAVSALGLGLVTIGAVVVLLFVTGSTGFFLDRTHKQSYDNARFHGQEASFALAHTHVFGVGPGQYAHVVGIAAHSTFLRALGEEGVLGLMLIVSLLLVTLLLAAGNVVHGRTTFGISSVPLLGVWIGLIANSFFIDTLHWRHLWFVAALIWVGACQQRRTVEDAPGKPTPMTVRWREGSVGRSRPVSPALPSF
jgi:O-antigen ligase